MRQHDDCGCGDKGPGLERLIALAREQDLPTVAVKPARLAASVKGRVKWALVNRAGATAREGSGPNLILDQGLDQIATQILVQQRQTLQAPTGGTYFSIIRYAAVGTNSAAPTVSQTALGAEADRTDATYASETLTRTAPGVYELTRFIEFDYAEGNGNLAEWGFSFDGTGPGLLFNRALFLDGGGDPEIVTKTSDFKLRLAYTLEIALSPVTLTSGMFSVTGVGTVNGTYALIGGTAPAGPGTRCGAPDLKGFSALARGALGTTIGLSQTPAIGGLRADGTDRSTVEYTDNLSVNVDTTTMIAARDILERDAYTPGSFERTGGVWKFETQYGNLNPVRALIINGAAESYSSTCNRAGYVFAFALESEFGKDDEHTLTIGVPTVSWGRA